MTNTCISGDRTQQRRPRLVGAAELEEWRDAGVRRHGSAGSRSAEEVVRGEPPRLGGRGDARAAEIYRITVCLADVEGYSYREPVSRSAASSHASTAVAAVSAL